MSFSKYIRISLTLNFFLAIIFCANAKANKNTGSCLAIEKTKFISDSVLKTQDEYKNFLLKNLNVKALEWFTITNVNVFLKTGEFETYNLLDEEENQTAFTKYGKFPNLPLVLNKSFTTENLSENPEVVIGFKTNYKILGINPSVLVLVDGVETIHKIAEQLDKEKINSIVVLKGKAATDLYGEKGKNGAVIILTKTNKE